MARLRETVAQVCCHEAARGRLAFGDCGRPALNSQQADVAVQMALFSEIVLG
ncbi:hypothetical protein [Deinococcus marmoris]|uniref:hypothetical protein n=1 Tax=Deinococcus marmoris TaxID=249408 RepID=UPI000B1F926F|nr:hypothetical protein [Deinococcus marmoris]